MEIVPNYLNKLKDLINMSFFHNDAFIDFVNELKLIYPLLVKEEIKNSFIKYEPSVYKRYAEQEIKEINLLDFKSEDKATCAVELWFIKYGLTFFRIESILNLDNETGLFSDLNYNILNAPDVKMADDLYNLQEDFLKFTKAYIANDIINYIESFKSIENSEANITNNINNNIDSLNNIESSDDSIKLENKINPHPRIFTCLNAYKLFISFKEMVNEKRKLADYSFIYRQMQKDCLIYQNIGDSEYRAWLLKNFGVDIEKTKQLYRCSPLSKTNLYSTLFDLNKPY